MHEAEQLEIVGAVDVESIPCLQAPPAAVLTKTFLLTLDDWGCWPRNGIGWASPLHIPEPLRDLAAGLDGWLRGAGFEMEDRAFTPHVTLLRKAQCVALPEPSACLASRSGGKYTCRIRSVDPASGWVVSKDPAQVEMRPRNVSGVET